MHSLLGGEGKRRRSRGFPSTWYAIRHTIYPSLSNAGTRHRKIHLPSPPCVETDAETKEEEGEERMAQPVTKRQELAVAISEVGEKYAFEAQSRTRTHSYAPQPFRVARHIGISPPDVFLFWKPSLAFLFPAWNARDALIYMLLAPPKCFPAPSLPWIRFHDLSPRGNTWK